MKNNFLDIKGVDFIIGGKTKVKNASFAIENEGETLCILGPSGIGKTTILRTIAGLENIEKGSIKLNGKLKLIDENYKIENLIKDLKIPIKKVDIELNEEIMNKKRLNRVKLKKNDQVEIVHFIGGG